MWESAFEIIASNGVWAVLFCLLLVYELKDSRKREGKYQQTITSLSDSLHCVNEIAEDVEEIAEDVKEIKNDVLELSILSNDETVIQTARSA